MRHSDVKAIAWKNLSRQCIDVFLHQGLTQLSDFVPSQIRDTNKRVISFVREQNENFEFTGIKAVDVTHQFGFDPGPAFSLSQEDAQVLMDSLWECGLRPAQGAGSAGQLDAVKYHLEDMRNIVNHKLGLK